MCHRLPDVLKAKVRCKFRCYPVVMQRKKLYAYVEKALAVATAVTLNKQNIYFSVQSNWCIITVGNYVLGFRTNYIFSFAVYTCSHGLLTKMASMQNSFRFVASRHPEWTDEGTRTHTALPACMFLWQVWQVRQDGKLAWLLQNSTQYEVSASYVYLFIVLVFFECFLTVAASVCLSSLSFVHSCPRNVHLTYPT